MTQHAAEGTTLAPAKNSHVPNMEYAYDVSHRDGLVTATVFVDNIAGAVVANGIELFDNVACKVKTGACVTSATGGLVKGFDMYGQYIEETLGAAIAGSIAFYVLTDWPADTQWVNEYGLPYKYVSGGAAGLTFTAHSGDTDERGTFVVDVGVTEEVEVKLDYIADQTNLMGDAYALRYASADFTQDDATITGTLTLATGAIAITVAAVADAGANLTFFFPDGYTETIANGVGAINHTLSPLWYSKYSDALPNVDKLVSFRGEDGTVTGYVDLTAS